MVQLVSDAARTREQPGKGTVRISRAGLTLNADDWGRDLKNTNRALECIQKRVISSASAMVFMEDSSRSAALALEHGVDCGLHLNLTTPFLAPQAPPALNRHLERTARFLRSHRLASALYRPDLAASFAYLVQAQLDAFERLYGAPPQRIDGHHHMHLCANVIRQKLLPASTIVRRNFSFAPGEKSAINRWYRARQDRRLARRHRMTDYFYSLPPLRPLSRVQHIVQLALSAEVEVETHPVNDDEYRFLTGNEFEQCLAGQQVSRGYHLAAASSESSA